MKIPILLILLSTSVLLKAQDANLRVESSSGSIYINIGSNAKLNISSPGNTGGIRLEAGGAIDNSGSIQLTAGAWVNNGNGLVNGSSGIVSLDNSSVQPVLGSSVNTFYDLIINNAAGVSLDKDAVVTHSLVLTSGSLSIGTNTLTINGAVTGSGTLKGSSTSNLIIGGAAGTLNFDQGSAATRSLKNFTLNAGATATLGNALDITAGASAGNEGTVIVKSGATLTTGGNLTIKSNAYGTARVGNSAGTINGNANVERYIPSRRAWKLLTVPVRNAGSIWNNWQNAGVVNGSTGVNIWGPAGTNPAPGANGLNYGPQYSMKQYNAAANNWSNTVTDTKNTALSSNTGSNGGAADNKAFLLFVTNPYDASGTNITPSGAALTTLRATGTLQQGNQSFPINAANYTLIGNPYASPVDFASLMTHNTSIIDRFWLYDATAATLGAYKMVYNSAGVYRIIPSPFGTNPGDPTADDYRHLQSGQAIFVQQAAGAGTLTFSESDKAIPGSSPGIYKVTLATPQELAINMYNNGQLLDGALMLYDNQFSNAIVATEDARKVYNDGANIAVARNNTGYSVEARPEIAIKDTSFLWISNTQANQNYTFSFKAAQFNPLVSAWLEDAYTSTRTAIDLSGAVNNIDFTTTPDAASQQYARFRIVYLAAANPLPISFTDVKAYLTAGSSGQNSSVKVEWKVNGELNADHYEVEYSTDGTHFTKLGSVNATGNNNGTVSYGYLHLTPATGMNYYRIKVQERSGSIKYSVIVKVAISVKGSPGIIVYPNPVVNSQAALQLHDLPAGNYETRIIGNDGRLISIKTISHNGGTASRQLSLPALTAPGVYRVQLTGSGKINYITTINIQ